MLDKLDEDEGDLCNRLQARRFATLGRSSFYTGSASPCRFLPINRSHRVLPSAPTVYTNSVTFHDW